MYNIRRTMDDCKAEGMPYTSSEYKIGINVLCKTILNYRALKKYSAPHSFLSFCGTHMKLIQYDIKKCLK